MGLNGWRRISAAVSGAPPSWKSWPAPGLFLGRDVGPEGFVDDRLLHEAGILRISPNRHGHDGVRKVPLLGQQLLFHDRFVGDLRVQVEKVADAQARMFLE